MTRLSLLPLLLFFSFAPLPQSDTFYPWGTDSALAKPPQQQQKKKTPSLARACILFHQKIISPADGPRSHFYPSSSEYAKIAIMKYGFVPGFILGCDRLLRENNDAWHYPLIDIGTATLKYDPVR